MNTQRISEIMKENEIKDIYYNNRAVWIQDIKENTATVGFIDNNEEKSVSINDLYE